MLPPMAKFVPWVRLQKEKVEKVNQLPKSAIVILFTFAAYSNTNNEVFLSRSEISEKTGYSLSMIKIALDLLVKNGLIRIINNGKGKQYKYIINEDVIWSASENKLLQAKLKNKKRGAPEV